jgi:CDP-glycerol glycerophosphotransferase (TagB/SpsB family)
VPRYVGDSLLIIKRWIQSFFFVKKALYRNAWLICERGVEARDNGFVFFKYLRENHPEINAYYLIESKNNEDYEKAKQLGNVVEYNSKEHHLALFFASYLLSTHVGYITPWSFVCYKTFFKWMNNAKFVLLNHGMTKEDMSAVLNRRVTGVDLFITANQVDYDAIAKDSRYGYDLNQVVLTGYARYDNWTNFVEKKQIVLMPTWRAYLVDKSRHYRNQPRVLPQFKESEYYKQYQSLLANSRLIRLLEEYDTNLVFYPHYEMQSALSLFSSNSERVIFANKNTHDIPTLLRESKLMITDYSGVGFDFSYMYKPILYYQFDQKEYYSSHYKIGDFSMQKDGVGEIFEKEADLIDAIERYFVTNFSVLDEYRNRIDKLFTFHDDKNCQRIFQAIVNYK